MKRIVAAMVLAAMVWPFVASAEDEERESTGFWRDLNVDFIVNACPASLLADVEGDKFEVGGTKVSSLFYAPNIAAGLEVGTGDFAASLTAGPGLLVNEEFSSLFLQLTAAATYAFSESATFGPRVGLVRFFDPEWREEGDTDFDAATGVLVGLQLTMGDRISYLISMDFLDVSFDRTDTGPGPESLEIEGLMFQFGVSGRF